MRTAAFITTLVGGIFGVLFGFAALAASSFVQSVEDAGYSDTSEGGGLIGMSIAAVLMYIAVIVASAFVLKSTGTQRLMALVLFTLGTGAAILIGWFGILPWILLFAAAILCLLVQAEGSGSNSQRRYRRVE